MALKALMVFLLLAPAVVNPFEGDALIGRPAPEFVLKDIEGRDVSLGFLRGKVVILSFWATWCPECEVEMPSLNRLYRRYRERGLGVLGVSADRSVSKVKAFLKKQPVDYPVVVDLDLKAVKKYKVYSIPTAFIIDRSGVIVEKNFGLDDWTAPETTRKIEQLLGK